MVKTTDLSDRAVLAMASAPWAYASADMADVLKGLLAQRNAVAPQPAIRHLFPTVAYLLTEQGEVIGHAVVYAPGLLPPVPAFKAGVCDALLIWDLRLLIKPVSVVPSDTVTVHRMISESMR